MIGANVAECSPITTDYIWRCRDDGGKLIVADPRMTPITRNADLYLPLRPGTDLALLLGMLHVILRDGLEDREFIAAHTTGFEAVARTRRRGPRQRAARGHRRAARGHRAGGALDRARPTARWRCTPAASSTSEGGRELPGA